MSSDAQWNALREELVRNLPRKIYTGCLVSPSSNGLGHRFTDLASDTKGASTTATIARYWVWANELHPTAGMLDRPNFRHFDHDWLRSIGVDPNRF